MSKHSFLKLEKHDFPNFLLQGFTKIAKVHYKKKTKTLTGFKLYNLDLHGECKRKV